jgi:hypothetical protein
MFRHRRNHLAFALKRLRLLRTGDTAGHKHLPALRASAEVGPAMEQLLSLGCFGDLALAGMLVAWSILAGHR